MKKVYVVIVDWVNDSGESDNSVYIFADEEKARENYNNFIAVEKSEDSIFLGDYETEITQNSYSVWESGYYSCNHWNIKLEEKIIIE